MSLCQAVSSTAVSTRHYKSVSTLYRLKFISRDLVNWLALGSPQFVPFRQTAVVARPGQSSQTTTVSFRVRSSSVLTDDLVH